MKILVAVDGSEFSDAAVSAVIDQFAPRGHEVRLLHAADWERHLTPPYLYAVGAGAAQAVLGRRDEILAEAQQNAERVAARLRAAGFDVSIDVRPEAEAVRNILDVARRWPADLIVVGSHGRSALQKLIYGSVSEAVVRHAPCSVEVVPLPPQQFSA
jgi:nucleotide-binding universal stress UspA family protein